MHTHFLAGDATRDDVHNHRVPAEMMSGALPCRMPVDGAGASVSAAPGMGSELCVCRLVAAVDERDVACGPRYGCEPWFPVTVGAAVAVGHGCADICGGNLRADREDSRVREGGHLNGR